MDLPFSHSESAQRLTASKVEELVLQRPPWPVLYRAQRLTASKVEEPLVGDFKAQNDRQCSTPYGI